MRLNKFIAHSGFCSRRKADQFIFDGKVSVNDQIITNPATDVQENDTVSVDNRKLNLESELVYFLLNKPIYTVTTVNDEKDRDTVVDIIKTDFRIYPIGRLDFMSTGVLLLTNDGDLTQKLSHPSTQIKKIYQVEVHGKITEKEIAVLEDGILLDDQLTYPAKISHTSIQNNKSKFQIEVHEGRNRQIRRMIDYIGFVLISLDRVNYAGLTYTNLSPGEYRKLESDEISNLKQLTGLN